MGCGGVDTIGYRGQDPRHRPPCEALLTTFFHNTGQPSRSDAIGLRLIVGFKLLKAGLGLAFGAVLLGLVAAGFTDRFMTEALQFRHHVAEVWSVRLAQLLIQTATVRHLSVIGLAAMIDGVSSLVEGWALYRRFWWSGWLIVCTTSAAIPLEVIAVIRHPSGVRIALLFTNGLIVLYLIRRRAAVTASQAP
jgi:uncharacterized membrane protein (DUF2068 family)